MSDIIQDEIKKQTETTLTGSVVTTAKNDSISHEAAFYFDVITEHSINIENSITDNFLENNTAIQDSIAHSPVTITLSGLVGELVYVPSTNNGRFLNKFYNFLNTDKAGGIRNYIVTDKLSVIGQLLPPVDNITQLAKNAVVYVEDSIARYKKIYDNFNRNINDKTKLQDVFTKLKLLRDNNTEMLVATPFATFDNMYIQNINFTQGNEDHVGNISLTLKQLNFTEIETTAPNENVLSKYNAYTQAQTENIGKADGIMSKDSTIGNIIYKFTGEEPYRFNQ